MSAASTFARRHDVAEKIRRQTGVPCEAVHPYGPIGTAYLVGWNRIGCHNAAEARATARRIRAEEDSDLYSRA